MASYPTLNFNLGETADLLRETIADFAAAELALAIAIILRLYRERRSVNVDEIDLLKG